MVNKYLLVVAVSVVSLMGGHSGIASPKCDDAMDFVAVEFQTNDVKQRAAQVDYEWEGTPNSVRFHQQVERNAATMDKVQGLIRGNCRRGDTLTIRSDWTPLISQYCSVSSIRPVGYSTMCTMK